MFPTGFSISSSRCALGLLAALTLAGCGFSPLYGTSGGESDARVVEELRHIQVPPIEDRIGQLVRIELTDRLIRRGPAPKPRYRLDVTLSESKQNLAVRKDATATRANLFISASYRLVPTVEGGFSTRGGVSSVNSYDVLENDLATLSAEQDARRRAARDLAVAIVDRLALAFRNAGLGEGR